MNYKQIEEIIKDFKGKKFCVRDIILRYNLLNLKNQLELKQCNYVIVASIITQTTGLRSQRVCINGKQRHGYDWR